MKYNYWKIGTFILAGFWLFGIGLFFGGKFDNNLHQQTLPKNYQQIELPTTQSYSGVNSKPDSYYQRTSPSYDPKAPLMPQYEGDIEPVYNEVQRLKEQEGMTDAEAVNKILRDAGEIP